MAAAGGHRDESKGLWRDCRGCPRQSHFGGLGERETVHAETAEERRSGENSSRSPRLRVKMVLSFTSIANTTRHRKRQLLRSALHRNLGRDLRGMTRPTIGRGCGFDTSRRSVMAMAGPSVRPAAWRQEGRFSRARRRRRREGLRSASAAGSETENDSPDD